MNSKNRLIDKNDDHSEDADAEVLRKEYRNMQANRNAFAHESEMVRDNAVMLANQVR